MILLALAAYELVARWPDAPQSDYARTYPSRASCERAADAIIAAHDRRVARVKERDRVSPTLVYTAPPPEPFVACVPR